MTDKEEGPAGQGEATDIAHLTEIPPQFDRRRNAGQSQKPAQEAGNRNDPPYNKADDTNSPLLPKQSQTHPHGASIEGVSVDGAKGEFKQGRPPPESEAEQADSGPEILDEAPAGINRPLCIVGTKAYAVATFHYKKPDGKRDRKLAVVRDDGKLFVDIATPDASPLTELGLDVRIRGSAPENSRWSAS